jgi:hypothetical protein
MDRQTCYINTGKINLHLQKISNPFLYWPGLKKLKLKKEGSGILV